MATLLSPAIVDITIQQGGEFNEAYQWEHDGVIQSLAGYTAVGEIRRYTGGMLILTLTSYLSIANNLITLDIPASITRTMVDGGVWDVFLSTADGVGDVRLIKGSVTLEWAVTLSV